MFDFVDAYKAHTFNVTDAPQLHQELMALLAIATCAGPVKIQLSTPIYPNLQQAILGRTFLERKTKGTYHWLSRV